MSCGGEITAVDRAPEGAGANGAYGDAANLYKHIARDQVFGLNLDPPESAKEAIKPWSERNSTEVWVESGVDDQVRLAAYADDHYSALYLSCAPTEHSIEPRHG